MARVWLAYKVVSVRRSAASSWELPLAMNCVEEAAELQFSLCRSATFRSRALARRGLHSTDPAALYTVCTSKLHNAKKSVFFNQCRQDCQPWLLNRSVLCNSPTDDLKLNGLLFVDAIDAEIS